MTPEIRTLTPEDAETYLRCVRTAFLEPEGEDTARARFWLEQTRPDLGRAWGAFDGGTAVGTLRGIPFRLTVPGGATVPADGISMVTVSPTHRRRGLLTGLMGSELRAAADRGEAAAILVASEWRIYGRYGFGPAVEATGWSIDRLAAGCPPPVGRLEAVTARELRELAPPAYDRARLQRAGGLDRPEPRWDRDFGLVHAEGAEPEWAGRAVVHRDDAGTVDGYLRWHATWDPATGGELTVDELIAATPAAYADLWRFALSVDLIRTVTARRRQVDEVLPWLVADGRQVRQTERQDRVWLRPLDVPALLTARDYGAAGRVVVEVVDPAGFAAGRYALDAGPDGAACTRTGAAADVTVPAAVLGSACLGGHRLATLAAAGLVDEHRAGAVARADRLLATDQPPWATLHF